MSKLIEQFLETHHQSAAQNSIFNINQVLDRESLSIYEQAQAEAKGRSKRKAANSNSQQKILNSALSARLTQLLDKVDLINIQHYTTLRNAIQRWCPWQASQQQCCLQVQRTLLTLLPVARQKQELRQLCQEYRDHLAVEIEKEAKNDPEQNYFACSSNRTLLFGAPPVSGYDLCLMSVGAKPEIGKVYLKEINGKIAYTVITPKGETVTDIQTEIKAPVPFDLSKLAFLKEAILKVASKAGHIPFNQRPQVTRVIDSRPPVEKLTAEPTRTLEKPSQPLSLVVQKYQAVSALQATLSTPVKSAPEQLKDFRAQFKSQQEIIEQGRDSWVMKFVKGVATVFSVGLAWALGIWNVKGKEAAQGLQTVLNQPLAPVVTCRVG